MASSASAQVRDAVLPRDLPSIERLWLEYLSWGNNEMEARYGFRLPVREAVDSDLTTIAKYEPPDGRLVLAGDDERAFGIGCLRRIGPDTGEIKRMYVEPEHRGVGAGKAILVRLIDAATIAGYARIRLDSPDFMTTAHGLYRDLGFVETGPYVESEIPDELKSHWVFMARTLAEPET